MSKESLKAIGLSIIYAIGLAASTSMWLLIDQCATKGGAGEACDRSNDLLEAERSEAENNREEGRATRPLEASSRASNVTDELPRSSK
jgi:hypothetical protein